MDDTADQEWLLAGQVNLRRSWPFDIHNRQLAERVGFEPTGPCGPPVFKTGAIVHSATSPEGLTFGGDRPPYGESYESAEDSP